MRYLTVLYDADCGLCCRARGWLEHQSQVVPLRFLAAGGEEAERRFPQLDHSTTLVELTVITDSGEIYRGAKAWVVCLWALRDYRSMAFTMKSPSTWWAAERFVRWVSANRRNFPVTGAPSRVEGLS